MTNCSEHLQGKLHGQRGVLCDTPQLPGQDFLFFFFFFFFFFFLRGEVARVEGRYGERGDEWDCGT